MRELRRGDGQAARVLLSRQHPPLEMRWPDQPIPLLQIFFLSLSSPSDLSPVPPQRNCSAVADPYLECEFMILLIDLILHKEKAYRHVIFNALNGGSIRREAIMWKSSMIYIIAELYRAILLFNDTESSKGSSFSAFSCGKVACGNLSFFGFLLLAQRFLASQHSSTIQDISSIKNIFLAVILSSYCKLFLALMMVWEFPTSCAYIIDAFVISSNFVALKALKLLPSSSCIAMILGAHGAKFLVTNTWAIFFSSFSY
ncbi:protein ARV 2-like isoform X2 [Wolffia australiana]